MSQTSKEIKINDLAITCVAASVPEGTDKELEGLVKAAKEVFSAWRATGIMRRQQIKSRYAASIKTGQGKTFAYIKNDVVEDFEATKKLDCDLVSCLSDSKLP